MESLPIPRLRSSWMAALLLTAITFLFYYLIVFNPLLSLYQSQFEPVYFEHEQNELQVLAYVPRYYNPSEPVWAYINVRNKSNEPIYDLEVYLVSLSEESTLLLPKLYNKEVYSSGEKFSVVEPHSIATARISLVAQSDPVINKVILIRTRDGIREELERQSPTEFVQPNKSSGRALQHSFLEFILLPPWSNGFILALVLFSTFLVRSRSEEYSRMGESEPKPLSPEWLVWVKEDIVKSAKIIFFLLLFATIFILINRSSLPSILCLIGLILIWVSESDFLKFDEFQKLIKPTKLIISALVTLGLISASLEFLYKTVAVLFSEFGFSWSSSIENWIWAITILASVLVLLENWRNVDGLNKSIQHSYHWRFLVISIFYLLLPYLIEDKPLETYYAWILLIFLTVGHIGIVFLNKYRNKPAQQNNSFIEANPNIPKIAGKGAKRKS